MKPRTLRPLAVLLAAALFAGSLTSKPSEASGLCVVLPATAPAGSNVDAAFIQMLGDYFDHQGTANGDGRKILEEKQRAQKILTHLFDHADSDRTRYEAELRFLDKYSNASPEAVFLLAKRLQLHWESKYGLSTLRVRNDSQTTGFEAGGVVGLLGIPVLGALMLKSPAQAPNYFRLLRHLIPVGAMVAGHGAGTVHASLINSDVPVSPAHLLRLGVPAALEDKVFTNDELYQSTLAMAASMAASSAFVEAWTMIRAAEAVNAAATPAKINPYVLVGSIALGIVVDYGASKGLQYYEKSTLIDAVRTSAQQLRTASRSGDPYAKFVAADVFVDATQRLAKYLYLPMDEVLYNPELSPADRASELASKAPFAVGPLKASIERYEILQALANGGTVEGLGSRAVSALAAQKRLQAQYVLENGEAQGIDAELCYPSDDEVAAEYATKARQVLMSELAASINKGVIPEDPLLLQLSAAATLESLKDPDFEDFATTLFSQVEHDLLVRRTLQPNGG